MKIKNYLFMFFVVCGFVLLQSCGSDTVTGGNNNTGNNNEVLVADIPLMLLHPDITPQTQMIYQDSLTPSRKYRIAFDLYTNIQTSYNGVDIHYQFQPGNYYGYDTTYGHVGSTQISANKTFEFGSDTTNAIRAAFGITSYFQGMFDTVKITNLKLYKVN
ncbi:MAG TPA: hypothetical protein PKE39_04300 [Ignavibacteria bacterium]|nr:hypothetical protein [Ignavibacteria bacterium]